jgi:hypothetical protein
MQLLMLAVVAGVVAEVVVEETEVAKVVSIALGSLAGWVLSLPVL